MIVGAVCVADEWVAESVELKVRGMDDCRGRETV